MSSDFSRYIYTVKGGMRFSRWEFHSKHLFSLFAFLTISTMVLAVAVLVLDLRKHELERARSDAVALTNMFMEHTEQSFENMDLVLRDVQERLQTDYGKHLPMDGSDIHFLLWVRAIGLSQVDKLFVVDAAGMVMNTSDETQKLKYSIADQEYYKTFINDSSSQLMISKPVRDGSKEKWTLYLARKFMGDNGKFRGTVIAAVDTAHIEQRLELLKFDHERPISLYLSDGTLIASLPHRESMIGAQAPELGQTPLPRRGDAVRFISHNKNTDERELLALGHVPQYPFLTSVANDDDDALASWREIAIPIVFTAILSCSFIIIVAWLMRRKLRQGESLAQALHESDERYYHTVNSAMDAIVAVDASHNIVLFNPSAERMFGYTSAEVIGKPLAILIPKKFHSDHQQHLKNFMVMAGQSRPMAPQLETVGLRADGSEFPIESSISHSLVGKQHQLTAVLRDVTERRKAERDLLEKNLQLRRLSASLQEVREQERARISRELHDDLGQQLTGIKLDMAWLSSRLKEGRTVALERVVEMRKSLDNAVASVRRISMELRPPVLDDLGFEDALTWQTEEFSRKSGLMVTLNLPTSALIKDDIVATALFRIVQESLTNIARHADATHVEIHLINDGSNLILKVCDNGKGFPEGEKLKGLGLINMRERANALGGEFSIKSTPSGGTAVEVKLPLESTDISGAQHEV